MFCTCCCQLDDVIHDSATDRRTFLHVSTRTLSTSRSPCLKIDSTPCAYTFRRRQRQAPRTRVHTSYDERSAADVASSMGSIDSIATTVGFVPYHLLVGCPFKPSVFSIEPNETSCALHTAYCLAFCLSPATRIEFYYAPSLFAPRHRAVFVHFVVETAETFGYTV